MVPKQLNNLNRGRKTSFDYEFRLFCISGGFWLAGWLYVYIVSYNIFWGRLFSKKFNSIYLIVCRSREVFIFGGGSWDDGDQLCVDFEGLILRHPLGTDRLLERADTNGYVFNFWTSTLLHIDGN